MKKYARDNRPYIKPVTRIELKDMNPKLRILAVVVLMGIGAMALAYGFSQLLSIQPGWQQVEISSKKPNCSGDFVLMYDYSDYGGSATVANKALTNLYTEAAEKAYLLFTAEAEDAAVQNLYQVNHHVNQTVSVEPELYQALSQIVTADNRNFYLAPVYVEYNRIFLCENEEEAVQYDPFFNEELRPYLQELAAFISNPEAINLELLGDNQVCLKVSDEYLSFVQEYEIETLVDFGWMKNAFIADYLANILEENGYTCGYLASFDGFTRNLDTRDREYTQNLFHREGTGVNMPGKLHYNGSQSIVFLRDYPMGDEDRWHYFAYGSGHITSIYIDPVDGMSKCSTDSLVGYSKDAGCAEILLSLIPTFIGDHFDSADLMKLVGEGIYTVWYEGQQVYTNDPQSHLELIYSDSIS